MVKNLTLATKSTHKRLLFKSTQGTPSVGNHVFTFCPFLGKRKGGMRRSVRQNMCSVLAERLVGSPNYRKKQGLVMTKTSKESVLYLHKDEKPWKEC